MMKNLLKKAFACLSTLTVLSVSVLNVSALTIGEDYPAYCDYVNSKYTRFEDEKEILAKYSTLKDVFYDFYEKRTVCNVYMVYNISDSSYSYGCAEVSWHNFYIDDTEILIPTEEEINTFLSENNFKATVSSYNSEAYSMFSPISLSYEEGVTFEDIVDIANALNDKFSMRIDWLVPVSMASKNIPQPTTQSPTITLFGDLDLDDKQGMSDIVALTKYNASPELYPITDKTALANADINQDGVIDALDTNILIEMTLGSFESAV